MVISEKKISLIDLNANKIVQSIEKGELENKKIYGVKLISLAPLNFIAN